MLKFTISHYIRKLRLKYKKSNFEEFMKIRASRKVKFWLYKNLFTYDLFSHKRMSKTFRHALKWSKKDFFLTCTWRFLMYIFPTFFIFTLKLLFRSVRYFSKNPLLRKMDRRSLPKSSPGSRIRGWARSPPHLCFLNDTTFAQSLEKFSKKLPVKING